MTRFLPLVIFGAIAALLLLGLLWGRPQHIPSTLIGKPLPELKLQGFDAPETIINVNAKLGRPQLLNIWASWCAPCRIEHPLLMKLAAQDITIIGLNYKDSPAAARQFLHQLGNPYHSIGVDADGRAAIELGVYGVPESFVIDADGIIRYRHTGPLTADALETHILPHLKNKRVGEVGGVEIE